LGLSEDKIEWTKGRAPSKTFQVTKPEGAGPITGICAVGCFLAVTFEGHPVIHVLTWDGELAVDQRLIDHTMPITALSKFGDHFLLSGSADYSAKIWDLSKRGLGRFSLERHEKAVAAVEECEYEKELIVWTGGDDATVRVWHLQSQRFAFQIDVGEGKQVAGLHFDPASAKLEIVVVPPEWKQAKDLVEKAKLPVEIQVFEFARTDPGT